MIVNNITATIRMSQQTPSNDWITVELGAEACNVADSDLTWQEQQAGLFHDLKKQLAQLVRIKTPPAHQAPAHEHTNGTRYEESLDTRSGELRRLCPEHKISRDSRHGGLFCPGKDQNGKHCTWTTEGPQQAKTGSR